MRTETEITFDGMQILIDKLGMVEAEKFIAIIHTESFDILNGESVCGLIKRWKN